MNRRIWNIVKKKFKIRSKDLFLSKQRRTIDKKIFKETFGIEELIGIMKNMGLTKGSNIFIHSSWDEFYNFKGSINDFIDAVLTEIGETGTLAMPAYPLLRRPDSIFDIKYTPTEAGLIAETFRNYPGVKRSINMHSVCATGPMSDFLIDEHKYSITSFDEKSPYFKLSEINAIIFTLGLGKNFVGTTMHCADSILRKEYPYFRQFFTKEITYKYKLEDRTLYYQTCLTNADDFHYRFTSRSHRSVIKKYFDKAKYKRTRLSNLTINMYDAAYFIGRIIELGRSGITVYVKPSPRKYFNHVDR